MTQAQDVARLRNNYIRCLRGIAASARWIPMPIADRNRILMGVDGALTNLGADSERDHKKKILAKTGLTEAEVEEILS